MADEYIAKDYEGGAQATSLASKENEHRHRSGFGV